MKRFYRETSVTETAGGWQVTLDGRPIRTAAGAPQVVPTQILAAALAREWEEQDEEIDPARFVFRDSADFAIDRIAHDRFETIGQLLGYGATDTLCYRADPEDALYERQQAEWEPLLQAIETRGNIRFRRVSGVIHRAQPDETLMHLRARLDEFDPFTLAGLLQAASLAASLCIALETIGPGSDPQHLWHLASLEEEWQAELWGREPMAEERRAQRYVAFLAACEFIRLVRG